MEELQEHINQETKDDIGRLYEHADIANKEMGEIKVVLAQHRGLLDNLREEVRSVNIKQWAIITMILTSAIATAFFR